MTTVANVYAALARTGLVTVEMLDVIPGEHLPVLMAHAAAIRGWLRDGNAHYAVKAADQGHKVMVGLMGAEEPCTWLVPGHEPGGPW